MLVGKSCWYLRRFLLISKAVIIQEGPKEGKGSKGGNTRNWSLFFSYIFCWGDCGGRILDKLLDTSCNLDLVEAALWKKLKAKLVL